MPACLPSQCANLGEVEDLLQQGGINYLKQCVIEEDGVRVTQVPRVGGDTLQDEGSEDRLPTFLLFLRTAT